MNGDAPNIELRIDPTLRALLAGTAGVVVSIALTGVETAADVAVDPDPEITAFLREFAAGAAAGQEGSTALAVQCALLDRFAVRQGSKAIAVFMHRHWSPGLARAFGPAVNPHSLRRWRQEMRSRTAVPSGSGSANAVDDGSDHAVRR